MPWTPEFAVIDASPIADNLMQFILTNQVDALAWAGGGGAGLKPLKAVTAKVTNPDVPLLPSIGIEGETETPEDTDGELLETRYTVLLEIWVENKSAEQVTRDAKVYKKAVVSMLQEIPNVALLAGTGLTASPIRDRPVTEFPAVRSLEDESHFFQMFRITQVYRLTGSAFAD